MSRLTDALLGMDEKLSRAFLERGILNLPASVTPRRPWRIALPVVVLAVVAALAVGLSLRRPAVAPAGGPTPRSGPALAAGPTATFFAKAKAPNRADFATAVGASEAEAVAAAKKLVIKPLAGREPNKTIFVPDRLVNFVV